MSHHFVNLKTKLPIIPNSAAKGQKLLIILRIEILNLHICIFSILDAVVNLGQYIMYTANERNPMSI